MWFPGTGWSRTRFTDRRHITQRGLPMDRFVEVDSVEVDSVEVDSVEVDSVEVDNAVGFVEIKEKSDARV
jgi:hypothetical protein